MQDRTPYKHNTMQSYKEIWKDVPGYEGHYQVSNLGRVKSLPRTFFGRTYRGKILSPTIARNYHHVLFSVNSNKKTLKVHRLVALAFLGESDLQVNHKNGIKTDNRLENLEYCTQSENMNHAVEMGVIKRGKDVNTNKLNENDVMKIKYGHHNLPQKEIAKLYGVTPASISSIRLGKTWKHI